MNSLTITLSEEYMAKLKALSNQLGTSPQELLQMSIEDLLAEPETAYQHAKRYVLKKNKELYQRLAT